MVRSRFQIDMRRFLTLVACFIPEMALASSALLAFLPGFFMDRRGFFRAFDLVLELVGLGSPGRCTSFAGPAGLFGRHLLLRHNALSKSVGQWMDVIHRHTSVLPCTLSTGFQPDFSLFLLLSKRRYAPADVDAEFTWRRRHPAAGIHRGWKQQPLLNCVVEMQFRESRLSTVERGFIVPAGRVGSLETAT
jgi:hypothetical protein